MCIGSAAVLQYRTVLGPTFEVDLLAVVYVDWVQSIELVDETRGPIPTARTPFSGRVPLCQYVQVVGFSKSAVTFPRVSRKAQRRGHYTAGRQHNRRQRKKDEEETGNILSREGCPSLDELAEKGRQRSRRPRKL